MIGKIMFFILFIVLMVEWSEAGLPPTSLKGQSGSKATVFNFEVPNYQATKTSTGSLIETGNKNLLVNPSFEHTTVTTGWSALGAFNVTKAATDGIDGARALLYTFNSTGTTLELTQDSTINAAQFADGVQGLAMVRVKTSVSGLKVCSRQAGTTSTTNCVSVNNDNKWGLYKVPFILGATSSGISIHSDGATITSNTVTIDDAFVGAVDLKQDVDQSRVAGESNFAGTTSCSWQRTSTTLGGFTADADCPAPVIEYSSMGTWSTTDADLPRQTVSNLPPGTYKATFIFGNISAPSNTAFAINDGTTTCKAVNGNSDTNPTNTVVSCTFNYTSLGNRVFELYAASASGAVTLQSAQTSPQTHTKFILEYFGSGSIYSSTCGANCVDTFSAKINSAGTVSGENIDWINGNASVTSTSQFTLTYNSNIFTVAPNCTITVYLSGGNSAATRDVVTTATSSTGLTYFTSANGTTATAYSAEIICQKTGADFTATRNIVGSFKEMVMSKGTDRPDIQSVYFGSGADCTSACTTGTCTICNQVGNKITSVTWSSTGQYFLNGIDGTKYNCTGTGVGGSSYAPMVHNRSSSTTTYARVNLAVGATVTNASFASVQCIGRE